MIASLNLCLFRKIKTVNSKTFVEKEIEVKQIVERDVKL